MTTEKMPDPTKDKEYKDAYTQILGRIHHEDTLINQRFGWLLTSQTIFCAICGFLFERFSQQNQQDVGWIALISLVPLVVCLISYASILAAIMAIYAFCKRLDQQYPQYSAYSQAMILGPELTHFLGQASPIFVPLGFVIIWVFAIFLAIFYAVLQQVILAVVIAFIPASMLFFVLATFLLYLWNKTYPYPLFRTLVAKEK